MSDQQLDTAVNQLINEVKKLGPNVQIAIRKIAQ
jgi:hypothetical protein